MDYDRTLGSAFVAALQTNPCLVRLVSLSRSPWGEEVLAHVEFRRGSSLQVYVGRTALLTVEATARGRFKLSAHPKYASLASDLLGQSYGDAELGAMADELEGYLRKAAAAASRSFTAGEGGVHAGFVRRYGQGFVTADPFLSVDKEIRVGFSNRDETRAFERELQARFGRAHRKLDSLGVLDDGNIGVVELKAENESLEVAAVQAATHVFTLNHLLEDGLRETLDALITQKVAVGLLPEHARRVASEAELVPVIAAPDSRADWAVAWKNGVDPVVATHPQLLRGLRMWRLSPGGDVVEARGP